METGEHLLTALISVLTAIVGVAIIAVIFSRGSQTSQVLSAGGNAFSNIIKAALGPTSGASVNLGSGFLNIGL